MNFQAAMEFRNRLHTFGEQAQLRVFAGNIINTQIVLSEEAISLRIYIPEKKQKMPIALFIHGGGFVAGSIASHENVCRALASGMSTVFVSVEYPLAPEAKYPKITDICYQALCWVANNAEDWGAVATELMIIGDSAGGTLAAVSALMARDRQGPKLSCQILVNPMVDLVNPGVYKEFRDCYLNNQAEQTHPYASPLYAKLHDLPETFIILHEEDCLLSQGQQYVNLLNAAGVKITTKCFPGGHLGYHFANADERAEAPIAWLIEMLSIQKIQHG